LIAKVDVSQTMSMSFTFCFQAKNNVFQTLFFLNIKWLKDFILYNNRALSISIYKVFPVSYSLHKSDMSSVFQAVVSATIRGSSYL